MGVLGRLAGAGVAAVGIATFAGVGAMGDETTRDESGAIVDGGGVGAFVLQEGDCFLEPDAGLVQSVEAVPCSEPHDAEVFSNIVLEGGAFPGDDALGETASDRCVADFDAYVGTPYMDSALDVSWLAPSEQSWTSINDTTITCLVVTMDGSQRTASAENSGV